MTEVLAEIEKEEKFIIDDDQKAEWALEQIRNAQEEKARWRDHFKEQLARINESCDLTINNMTEMLRDYFDTIPHKVTKTEENYRLPSGKLVLKKQATEFDYDDADLIDWLEKNKGGQFIKMKKSVDWMALKKTLTVVGELVADDAGEIIPCIQANERPDVFTIEK